MLFFEFLVLNATKNLEILGRVAITFWEKIWKTLRTNLDLKETTRLILIQKTWCENFERNLVF